jgi:hypothetical protein
MKITLNGGKRHIHDCGVENDHQLADAEHDQGDPSPSVTRRPMETSRLCVQRTHRHTWPTPGTGPYSPLSPLRFERSLGNSHTFLKDEGWEVLKKGDDVVDLLTIE